jgi:1,4-dihydroxy-6-naphthoate synthase
VRLTIGHTPDVDDAYFLYGLLTGKVDLCGVNYVEHVEPISILNEMASGGQLDVTALSAAHYPRVWQHYSILPSGACMAEDRGPILVSRPGVPLALVAVPSTSTTAWLAARCLLGPLQPCQMPFHQILDAVDSGDVPAGIIISEDQERIPDTSLQAIDLGLLWKQTYGLPLPLGIDLVRTSLPSEVALAVAATFRASVQYALDHPDEAMSYALRHARRTDPARAASFARTFVGSFTLDLGSRGRTALTHFLAEASSRNLVPGDYKIAWVDA